MSFYRKQSMLHNWSKTIPSSSTLGTILRLPLRLIPGGTVVKVRAGLNKGMKWKVGSGAHGCWLGLFELEKQAAMKPFIKPGMTVFDIGANAGFYTLTFSCLVEEQGRVWAFEPLAENANNILRHINLNRLTNVTLLQAAVVDHSGLVGFRIGENNATGTVSDEEELYKVPAVFLDNLVEAGAVPVPDVVKIDVEGFESSVLVGSKKLLAARQTTLFIALHGDEERKRCRKILESFRYKIFLLDGTAVGDDALQGDEIYAIPD